jgi:hypothetical protein
MKWVDMVHVDCRFGDGEDVCKSSNVPINSLERLKVYPEDGETSLSRSMRRAVEKIGGLDGTVQTALSLLHRPSVTYLNDTTSFLNLLFC